MIPRPLASVSTPGAVPAHEVRHARDERLGPEGYRLVVRPDAVELTSGGPAGRFYGLATLARMASCGVVEDRPRYAWRGVMLDVARHFMPKEFVLRLIDVLALHRLNVLHLHLTDDQGWRLEIKRHPRLTEVSGEHDPS